ncbi:hypothetical protein ACFSBZ_06775 [Amnibacterium flavum]|uniref:hypothetical protein n=1 Tax=Amnibacterium flavum TaxID=2173173 RepID=UPI001F0C1C54|nr:hypothetical protein [Amnibacterium flavum]
MAKGAKGLEVGESVIVARDDVIDLIRRGAASPARGEDSLAAIAVSAEDDETKTLPVRGQAVAPI